MNKNTLMKALPIVAAAYGRKFGVQVEVGGDEACTNGQVVRIPDVGDDPLAKSLAWGYLSHEAAHVRFTDFQASQATFAKGGLVRSVLNILEDVRIEKAIIGTYPGTRSTLDEVLRWLLDQGTISAPKEGDSPPGVLGNALLVMARHRYRRQVFLKKVALEAERVLRKTFPPSFVHRLLGLLTEVPGLASTQETADLAERIVALIQDEAKESPPPSEKPAAPDEAEGDGEGADQPEEGDEEDGGGPGQSSEGQDGPDEPGQGAGNEDGDGRKALQALLSAGAGDLPGDAFEEVAKSLEAQAEHCDSHVVRMPSMEDFAGNAPAGQVVLARVRGESAKLTARLQGLVEAHQMAKNRTVRRGRALNPTALHRAAVGDDRVFLRKDSLVAPNTALHLIVDLSGSMGGFQDSVALDAAMALALALEPMRGVSCAVTAFPSLDGRENQVTRILSHGDSVARNAGAFVQRGRGCTPMTGALWFAAADLLARREERKVILTLTDGQPDDFDSAKEMAGKATAAGIEMIGVGIATRVDRLFPVAITIGSVADLKGQLFGIAEQLLLR